VHAFIDAVQSFGGHLARVHWEYLAIAVVFHVLKCAVSSLAWRNVVAAAYPKSRVPWPTMFGAYLAGVGVNAVIPARGGDVVKLFIAKRRIQGATYVTLASTIAALTVFDLVVALGLLIWAISIGVLPSLDVLPDLPDFDFGWFFRHPRVGLGIGAGLVVALVIAGIWAARRIEAFKRRVAMGFAIFKDRPRYLREVASLQALDWVLRVVTIYWFLRAFGIPADAYNALLVQVTASLSTVFPFSPGGIGTEQALTLYVLAGEAPRSALLAFSVGQNVTTTIVNGVLGLAAIALLLRTLRFRRLAEADAAQSQLAEERSGA
jgi:glycosyltransferase 2 family protein